MVMRVPAVRVAVDTMNDLEKEISDLMSQCYCFCIKIRTKFK